MMDCVISHSIIRVRVSYVKWQRQSWMMDTRRTEKGKENDTNNKKERGKKKKEEKARNVRSVDHGLRLTPSGEKGGQAQVGPEHARMLFCGTHSDLRHRCHQHDLTRIWYALGSESKNHIHSWTLVIIPPRLAHHHRNALAPVHFFLTRGRRRRVCRSLWIRFAQKNIK